VAGIWVMGAESKLMPCDRSVEVLTLKELD
jgi:hypothetical protein